jgi:hypothetical protein
MDAFGKCPKSFDSPVKAFIRHFRRVRFMAIFGRRELDNVTHRLPPLLLDAFAFALGFAVARFSFAGDALGGLPVFRFSTSLRFSA